MNKQTDDCVSVHINAHCDEAHNNDCEYDSKIISREL